MTGRFPPASASTTGPRLVFAGTELAEIVTARPEAGACRVELVGRELVETRLEARLLEPSEHDRVGGDPALGELQDLRAASRPSLGLRR